MFLAELWHADQTTSKMFGTLFLDKVADAVGSSWFPRMLLVPVLGTFTFFLCWALQVHLFFDVCAAVPLADGHANQARSARHQLRVALGLS